jgi:hypothetical protein
MWDVGDFSSRVQLIIYVGNNPTWPNPCRELQAFWPRLAHVEIWA